MKTSLILGTGALGLAVMDELVIRKHQVIMVNRSGKVNELLPATVEISQCDLMDTSKLNQLCKNVDQIYMCAVPPYHKWVPDLIPLIKSVLAAAQGKQLVYGDNMYMYGAVNTDQMTEISPYVPNSRKGRVRKEAAELMEEADRKGSIKLGIVRGSDFYGPRVSQSAFGTGFFSAIQKGKSVNVMGNIDNKHSITYIRDFARTMVIAANHSEATKSIYHVPNMDVVSVRTFGKAVAEISGGLFKPSVMPIGMMRILGLFIPALKELIEMQYQWQEDFVVSHKATVEELGIEATSMTQGVYETLEWIKNGK